MKVRLILTALLLGLSLFGGPTINSATSAGLKVHMINGDEQIFLFVDKPSITYLNDACVITTNKLNVSFKMSNISFAEILNDEASVNEVIVSTPTIDLSNPDVARIIGIQPLSAVILYDLKGMEMSNNAADIDGCASIDLSSLSKGSYIIFTNQSSFKIYKK